MLCERFFQFDFYILVSMVSSKLSIPAICWDQWFPEAARAMVLQGAEILFYPTAIGSEPQDDGLDSRDHWKRVMQGHAGANIVSCIDLQTRNFFHCEIE